MALRICMACDRHRRLTESVCPFCGATEVLFGPPSNSGLVSRAALVFGGVALAAAVSCSPKYGAPPPPDPMPPPRPTVPEATAAPLVELEVDAAAAAASAATAASLPASGFGTVRPSGSGRASAPAYAAPPPRKN